MPPLSVFSWAAREIRIGFAGLWFQGILAGLWILVAGVVQADSITLLPTGYSHDERAGHYTFDQLHYLGPRTASKQGDSLVSGLEGGNRTFAIRIKNRELLWGTNGPFMLNESEWQVRCDDIVPFFRSIFLGTCLKNLAKWLRQNASSVPIVLFVLVYGDEELTSLSSLTADDLVDVPEWAIEQLMALDEFIYSQLRGFMYRSGDLAAQAGMEGWFAESDTWRLGWPDPELLKNKVIVVLLGGAVEAACDDGLLSYLEDYPATFVCSDIQLMDSLRSAAMVSP